MTAVVLVVHIVHWKENWHESDEVVEEGKNDDITSENDVHWVWHTIKM
jgi:hypothetical protein